MFSKYWRTYPWWLQLILYVLMVFTLGYFFVVIAGLTVPKLAGVDTDQLANITEKSPRRLVDGALLAQALVSLGVFLLPALLFAYVNTPRPAEFLGLRKPGNKMQLVLVILLMVGFLPIMEGIQGLMKNVDLGPAAKAAQAQNDNLTNAFLKMVTPWDFIKTFTIMAILPAIGEEMTFRGVLMRFSAKRGRGIVFPIVITALMFAAMHGNITGLPSIFLAGIMLGVIYYLTGSLWCSIVAHMLNNGLQIIAIYLWRDNATFKATDSMPVSLIIGGIILFAVSLALLIKYRTPLPRNWTDDFTTEELIENAG